MKRDKETTKIPTVQTLVSMSRNPSQPSSSELVELHVFYVPEGSWNYKLNTISIEVINKFISAGFIRVSPQLTLQALRLRLGEFLGEDAVAEKFLFLKCIGNNLAVVKEKQEPELKLKSFAPPYALQPELYLLPVMDHLGNVYSAAATVTLDERQTNSDIAEIDGTIHRPVSVTLPKEELGKDPSFLENTLKDLINKNQEEAEEIATPKESQTLKYHIGNSELPGSLEDSNDYFTNKESQFLWKNEEDTTTSQRQTSQVDKNLDYVRTMLNKFRMLEISWKKGEQEMQRSQEIATGFHRPPHPFNQMTGEKDRITLPDLTDFPSFPCQPVLSSGIPDIPLLKIEREKIIEQMKQVKEERRYLERIRDELIKKVQKLFDQSKVKRYHAFDGWKKKYLETKKVTASLEDILTKLRDDLELYYKKLLMQLEAREIKMRPKNLANITDSKNNLIIQITEVQHAIDQLKRKLDTDKMKLIIEVKMRKQAVSDLRTLKTEMARKKTNTSFQSQLGSLSDIISNASENISVCYIESGSRKIIFIILMNLKEYTEFKV